MSVVNMVKTIKTIHPKCVVIVKKGNFYHVYGKDAYIFSYLLNYKIITREEVPCCGFPINAISKVENILERNKINYIAVDRRNNYDEEEKFINKQENNYDKIFQRAEKSINIQFRIQEINEELIANKNEENITELLDKIEKVINNERRKV